MVGHNMIQFSLAVIPCLLHYIHAFTLYQILCHFVEKGAGNACEEYRAASPMTDQVRHTSSSQRLLPMMACSRVGVAARIQYVVLKKISSLMNHL